MDEEEGEANRKRKHELRAMREAKREEHDRKRRKLASYEEYNYYSRPVAFQVGGDDNLLCYEWECCISYSRYPAILSWIDSLASLPTRSCDKRSPVADAGGSDRPIPPQSHQPRSVCCLL